MAIRRAVWLCVLLAGNGQVSAVDVTFNQVDWLDNNGGYTSEKSDWGEVTVQFSSADSSLFTHTGSSFVGYVNIVTTVPGGSSNNWAVVNAPVVFNNLGKFDGGFTKALFFDLGVPRGSIRVTSLQYRLTVDGAPLGLVPLGPMTVSGVGVSELLFGGMVGVLDGTAYAGKFRPGCAGPGT